jgi:hypothetical protein
MKLQLSATSCKDGPTTREAYKGKKAPTKKKKEKENED